MACSYLYCGVKGENSFVAISDFLKIRWETNDTPPLLFNLTQQQQQKKLSYFCLSHQ